VETFPRHGNERTHRVLTGPEAFGGWKVNFKRVHRIWKDEHMQVPSKAAETSEITLRKCQWLYPPSGNASEPCTDL
jgi:hypothetical protein